MKVVITVPEMGESVSEATVARLMVESGAKVSADDELLELETDKANQVLYASASGIVHLDVALDDTVTAEQVIGYIESDEKAAKKEKEKAPTRRGKEEFVKDLAAKEEKPAPKVEKAKPKKESERRETRQEMSKIRKIIAHRLVEVQANTAMLTTFNEVDMTAVMGIRAKYRDKFVKDHGVRLGFMSFFVKACVSALEAFPGLNSYIDGDDIVERHYFDVGIAVGTERGLIVPVVRDCDKLNFAKIEGAITDFAQRGRSGGLSVDELKGGGFTITNGGVYGSLLSTPILNPPQSGILGMHKIEKRPVVIDDQIVIRPMMYLALSYDHRIVDGQTAVSFLVHMKECLEDPSRLLLHI